MSEGRSEKILFVDDDKNLLEAIARQYRGKYRIETAESGNEALTLIERNGPLAVIVTEMKMPEMDGLELLAKVKKLSPNTVFIISTGNPNLEIVTHAVNDYNIFRFLLKPCHKMSMEWALDAALEQYRLVISEKELVENSLKGCLKVITDLMALANPLAFSRAIRIKNYMKDMAMRMVIDKPWQFELAGLLSQIGCIGMPRELLDKVYAGEFLEESEMEIFKEHPKLAKELLGKVPRMEIIASMISNQLLTMQEYDIPRHAMIARMEVLGGLALKAVLEFDSLAVQGFHKKIVIEKLKARKNEFHPLTLQALDFLTPIQVNRATKKVPLDRLDDLMILSEDIRTTKDHLLAAKGQYVTTSLRLFLKSCLNRGLLVSTDITVFVGGQSKDNEQLEDENVEQRSEEEAEIAIKEE